MMSSRKELKTTPKGTPKGKPKAKEKQIEKVKEQPKDKEQKDTQKNDDRSTSPRLMAEAAPVLIKNGQTALAIDTFFKKLSKLPEKREDMILSLAEHLVACKLISYAEMEDLKRKYPQTNAIVTRMEALIKRKDSTTWAAILRWLEVKPLMQNELLPVVERYELQYVLEELFKCERDVTASYSTCMDRLIRIASTFGHRVGSETEGPESMYETIRNSIRRRYLPIDKLRGFLTRELTKAKPEGLLLGNITREAVSWQSFVGAMKRPKSSGNPFIFYAAAKYLELHVHVISAISSEEYIFYPFYQPSLRTRCPHIYIGHVYRNYYVSLYPRTEHVYKDIKYHLPLYPRAELGAHIPLYPRTELDYALTRQMTLGTIDRLHREKYYIESELGEIKGELRRLKLEKGSEPIDSKSRNNYQKQIQMLKDQITSYEKESREKEELVQVHNDQLKNYEQMLKKSMDETKRLRKYIEERDEKFRKDLEEKTEEQKRIIEDFVAQTSDRVSGASVRAVNTWSTGSNQRDDIGRLSPRTSRRPPDTSRNARSYSPPPPPTQDTANVRVYDRTSDPPKRRVPYSESKPQYQRRQQQDYY